MEAVNELPDSNVVRVFPERKIIFRRSTFVFGKEKSFGG